MGPFPHDAPPAKISAGATVSNSLISHGCHIVGRVEHSVLSPGVFVAEGAVVRDSIIMNDTIVGRNAVVSFPNFGHWKIRLQLFFGGHMPSTDNLPYAWWDSPNIHFCTIKDFVVLCDVTGAKMDRAVAFNAWGAPLRFNAPWWFWNLFGEQAVFLLSRRGG